MLAREFLGIMNFPSEWLEYDMYPDELWEFQKQLYEAGHERASEHDRNGAFHWWLKRPLNKNQILKLVKLTYLDPDQIMAEDVRDYIKKSPAFDGEVAFELAALASKQPD